MHETGDHLLIAALLAAPIAVWLWLWPIYKQQLASEDVRARISMLRGAMMVEWLAALSLLGMWEHSIRAWPSLGLGMGQARSLSALLGMAGALGLAVPLWLFRGWILASPSRMAEARKRLAHAQPLLPHTQLERWLFWGIALTAGICEELVYRGFVTWYLAPWVGTIAALALGSLLYGFSHIYLGIRRVPAAVLAGLLLSALVYWTKSLLPAMALHAVIDWHAGELGFGLLRHKRS